MAQKIDVNSVIEYFKKASLDVQLSYLAIFIGLIVVVIAIILW